MSFVPTLVTIALCVITLSLSHFILTKSAFASRVTTPLMRQLTFLALAMCAVLLIVLSFPIGDSMRGQILSFLGIVSSAAIALSSTTFLGNIMAGLMLKVVKSIRAGDFIRIEDHFGRVSELGLLHTEIQTEDRDLTTLPNLYLVTNPVKVVRSSGTVVTATVSLGYDVPQSKIVAALEKAAKNAELEDPFVHVLELGDYSVVYRIAGFLREVKTLLSARSRLRSCTIHSLHEAGIEIVSPTFMNQRQFKPDARFIPAKDKLIKTEAESPEDLIFDKADQAESVEMVKEKLSQIAERAAEAKGKIEATEDEKEKAAREQELSNIESQQRYLEQLLVSKQKSS